MRKAVAIPVQDLDAVAAAVGEDEQMPGERVQIHRLRDQGVQAIEALAHVAGRCAKPSRSQYRILMRSRRRLAKTNRCPANASRSIDCVTRACRPSKLLRMSQADAQSRRDPSTGS